MSHLDCQLSGHTPHLEFPGKEGSDIPEGGNGQEDSNETLPKGRPVHSQQKEQISPTFFGMTTSGTAYSSPPPQNFHL